MQRDAAPRTSAALRTDLAVLFLSAVCVIFSFRGDEGAVALQPSWAHAYDAPALRADDPLPAPVVADLDDDGAPEVLVATRDGRLLLLDSDAGAAVRAKATKEDAAVASTLTGLDELREEGALVVPEAVRFLSK